MTYLNIIRWFQSDQSEKLKLLYLKRSQHNDLLFLRTVNLYCNILRIDNFMWACVWRGHNHFSYGLRTNISVVKRYRERFKFHCIVAAFIPIPMYIFMFLSVGVLLPASMLVWYVYRESDGILHWVNYILEKLKIVACHTKDL